MTTGVESGGHAVGLSEKAARLLTEREVVAQLVRWGVPIENRSPHHDVSLVVLAEKSDVDNVKQNS